VILGDFCEFEVKNKLKYQPKNCSYFRISI